MINFGLWHGGLESKGYWRQGISVAPPIVCEMYLNLEYTAR